MKFQADASSPACSESYLRRGTARLTRPFFKNEFISRIVYFRSPRDNNVQESQQRRIRC